MSDKPGKVHCDGGAIKNFFSAINSKLYAANSKKDI